MKKLVALVALVSIVLSSCTSSKNSMVVKRKYNKGFYVAHNHKKNNIETTDSNISSEKSLAASKSEEMAAVLPSVSLISEKATYGAPEIKNTTEIKKNNITDLKHNTVLVDSKNVTASAEKTPINVKHDVVKVDKESMSNSGSNTNLILLIIFCFIPILSLVAMYLHDGNSITLNFWIDLLLYLTFIGWIIFGLLVVLDIVNLA